MTTSDELLRPAVAYRETLYAKHKLATREWIEALTAQAGIDVEQNRKTVSEFNRECEIADSFASSTKKWKGFRKALVGTLIISLLAAAAIVYFKAYHWLILCAVILAASLLIWLMVVNPKVKNKDSLESEHRKKAAQLKNQAWGQMRPLNELLDGDITRQLIEKTVPQIKIDRYFDVRRLKQFEDGYGYKDSDQYQNMSTVKVMSGELNGNPYIIERYISCAMGKQTYVGTRDIVWYDTYTYYDSEGNEEEIEREHRETLRASVTKPMPVYEYFTQLTYGNEAAPDLSFYHKMTHAERMPEKKREKFVKSEIKKLRRMEQQAGKTGSDFTNMGNDEFEAIFNASDRDNELQFRLLFTPLAQENMMELMLSPEPYGDDFNFEKDRMLNSICAEHGKNWDLNTDAKRYYSYSYDTLYQAFIDYNVDYFRRFYFTFAPILAIPLYQQYKSREQIYGERKDYKRNYASNQAEALANAIGQSVFKPKEGDTETILKTKLISKNGDVDTVRVTAKSYKIVKRVDVVSVKASNGVYYDVEVPWNEYIPVSSSRDMEMRAFEWSEPEYQQHINEERFRAYTSSNKNQYAYSNGIFACALQNCGGLSNITNE